MTPKVSVLMPVYNGEKYLKEAIESILNQTFSDFEFLIIDDGSTDKTKEIINSYNDKRIRFIQNEENIGLPSSLNKGLKLAKGEYIARMDSDDVSIPDRLKKQITFMNSYPDIDICGSWIKYIKNKNSKFILKLPHNPDIIKSSLLFSNSLAHPTTVMRKRTLFDNKLFYDPQYTCTEDYELWARNLNKLKFACIPEALLNYRIHNNQICSRKKVKQSEEIKKIQTALVRKIYNNASENDINIHEQISTLKFSTSKEFIKEAESWLLLLQYQNKTKKLYPEPALSQVLAQKWFLICKQSYEIGFWSFKTFAKSPLAISAEVSFIGKARFLLACLLK